MHPATKIATCSYCGRRQTLQPTAREGHELACGACGAPLHEMKWLRAPEPERVSGKKAKIAKKRSAPRPAPHGRTPAEGWFEDDRPNRKRKSRKRRKGLFREVFEEAFDVIEDIFD